MHTTSEQEKLSKDLSVYWHHTECSYQEQNGDKHIFLLIHGLYNCIIKTFRQGQKFAFDP